MNQLTAHKREYTRNRGDLYLAFELGSKEWKLGFSVGFGQRPRERTVLAGDLSGVKREIERAKRLFGSIGEQAALGWEACAFGVEEAPCARVRAAGDG